MHHPVHDSNVAAGCVHAAEIRFPSQPEGWFLSGDPGLRTRCSRAASVNQVALSWEYKEDGKKKLCNRRVFLEAITGSVPYEVDFCE